MLEAAIAEGYPQPASNDEQCEHDKYRWDDCIACYDAELAKVAERMRALSAPPAPTREAIARIVDPAAFKSWAMLYQYCKDVGDNDETAERHANDTHLPEVQRALAKADAILALSQPRAFVNDSPRFLGRKRAGLDHGKRRIKRALPPRFDVGPI
jgi:hypothetical protein